MSVGVLNDEAQNSFWRLHGDVETHWSPEIMKVHIARPDREPVQQLRDCLAEGGKRDRRQDVGLAEARQIGRDHVGSLRQPGTTSRNVRAELGNPCRSSTAGLDASPAVMNDNSVPPDRRSRCRVGGRIS
jgi:hypothetical protein